MKTKQLIADSGGSKTAWAYLEEGALKAQFETSSLHPRYLNQFSFQELETLSSQLEGCLGASILFYGAGCSAIERQKEVKAFFSKLGFQDVIVYPDTLAACRASLGNEKGFVAILGTGSVLLDYNGVSIDRLIGGLGAIIGDEGSGMNFAKLLVKSILEDRIPLTNELEALFESKAQIRKQLADVAVLPWLSQIAGAVAKLDLQSLHEQNAQAFFETHLKEIETEQPVVNIVGTYGAKQRAVFEAVLAQNGWELGKTIEQPILNLVEYHLGLIE